MDKKKRKPGPTAQRAAMEDAVTLREQGRGDILSDVLGSYTGTAESGEIPEQDADDLSPVYKHCRLHGSALFFPASASS